MVLTSIIAILIVIGGILTWNFVPQRRRAKRFKNRPELDFDQIYKDFFAHKGLQRELVYELWNEIAQSLDVPLGKIRPSDRFDQELAAPKGWEYDDNLVEVQWAAERRLKRVGVQVDLSQIKTISDYVELFCRLQGQAK